MDDRVRSRSLLAFARELQRASTFEELLETTRAEIETALGYKTTWLFVADDENARELRLIESAGLHAEAIARSAPVLRIDGNVLLEEILRSDEPVIVTDARTDPRTDKKRVAQIRHRTLINVPLRLVDRPFGAFGTGTFGEEGPRPPSPEALAYLVGMASQLAVAAGRIRFLQEREASRQTAERAAARLRMLAESSRQFQSADGVEALVEVIARRFSELVGQSCAIRLVKRDGKTFDERITASYHPDPELVAAARELAAQPLRVGEGMSGRVLQTGEPLLLREIPLDRAIADTPPRYQALRAKLKMTSLLAVPLKARACVIGVIVMTRSDASDPYTTDDQQLAQDIADRAALAIENALLVDELEERVARRTADLEDANRALRRMQQELEILVDTRSLEVRSANEALGRSEARFRRLAESGILGIVLTDMEGKIHGTNEAFLKTLGYSRDDFLTGKVTGAALNTADRDRTDAAPRAAARTSGVARPWEKVLVHKDGSRVPVLVGVARVDEHSEEYIAFVLDLTELRRAEAAERESEARKTAVMEAALDAIVLMDGSGRIIEFNAAAERMFGYSRQEVVGRPLAEVLIPTGLRADHARGLANYLATGEARVLGQRLELPALRKDGTEFPAEVAVVRIRSEGAPLFTGYIRDITDRRQAAETEILRREKEAAEVANRELEAFSYSVAHDLRSPLRGISGFCGVLLEDHAATLDEDAKSVLRRVTASAERMGQIIDALLSLARLSTFDLRQETVDLAQMARSIVEHLHAAEPARSVQLVAPDRVMAHGDARLLRVVLENLLGNAWKFTRKRSDARIELGSTGGDEGRSYFVEDNGAGFDMAFADRLFSPFQRLHSSDQFEGTGVGLATVQRIVRRHGGRVWAESRENEGALFRFTLATDGAQGNGVSWRPRR